MDLLIEKTYYNPLSKLLNYSFFSKIISNKSIESEVDLLLMSGLIKSDQRSVSYNQIIALIYSYFKNHYRCEYVFKNELIKRIYENKKELYNDVHLLSEFRVNFSKADYLAANGHITIYEIKTDLDSLNRLKGQLDDYLKIAQFVNIVTSPKFVKALAAFLPENIGVMVLDENNSLYSEREAVINNNIDLEVVFSVLNNNEHRSIIAEANTLIPIVSNTIFYETYLSLFKELDPEVAYSLFIKQIKKRRKNKFNPIGITPDSILGIAINQNNSLEMNEFFEKCNADYILHHN